MQICVHAQARSYKQYAATITAEHRCSCNGAGIGPGSNGSLTQRLRSRAYIGKDAQGGQLILGDGYIEAGNLLAPFLNLQAHEPVPCPSGWVEAQILDGVALGTVFAGIHVSISPLSTHSMRGSWDCVGMMHASRSCLAADEHT